MPELPEVETIRRRLAASLPGLIVRSLAVIDATVSSQSEAELRALVVGRRLRCLRRRGKYLILDFGATLLIVHLRMTGQLLFEAEDSARRPRCVITFGPATDLYFYDTRRFGRVRGLAFAEESSFFARLGVEPLSAEFTPTLLRQLLHGRRTPLKAFLLDQRHIAGMGNIYADEALFRARLHPLRPAGSVGVGETQRLHAAIQAVLRLGIDHEGASVESFIDPAGARGSFQKILNVYQRTGEPCRVCGTPVERIIVSGRSTHSCPRCQPRRRRPRPIP
ncbi:MAG: bifunctional DNA-formamidopyrimidine glycosylase/DNA-(apurinic or apyrimidinic site) lyase [Thermoleophilia bacterium]